MKSFGNFVKDIKDAAVISTFVVGSALYNSKTAEAQNGKKMENTKAQTEEMTGMEITKSRQEEKIGLNNSKNQEDICKHFPVEDVTDQGIDMEGKDFKFENGYMYYSMGSKVFKIPVKPKKGDYEITEYLNPDIKPVTISDDKKKALIFLYPKEFILGSVTKPGLQFTWKALSVDQQGNTEEAISIYFFETFVKTGKNQVILGDVGSFRIEKPALIIYNQVDGSINEYSKEDIDKFLWNKFTQDEQMSAVYSDGFKDISKGGADGSLLLEYAMSNDEAKKFQRFKAVDIEELLNKLENNKK